jgi:hypothetical protein
LSSQARWAEVRGLPEGFRDTSLGDPESEKNSARKWADLTQVFIFLVLRKMSGHYTEINHDCHNHYLSMSFDVATSVVIKKVAI